MDRHRLSRHAIMYKCDLRTSSAALDTPMSASSRSSSSRSRCLRSHLSAIPASNVSEFFQLHLRSGKEDEAASRVLVELQVVLPQDMFHLRNGAKQRLAAGAHRAVVNGPSDFCIIPTSGAQAIVGEHQLMKSPGLPSFSVGARKCLLLADTKSKIERPRKSRESRFFDVSTAAKLCRANTKVRGRFCRKRYGPSRRRVRNASAVFKIFVLHPKRLL
jgi:hypothetical protein